MSTTQSGLPEYCQTPPDPERQCSDPNDFSKLTEANTDLADREACWMRYKDIIYLTIYHEFSMDNQLIFTPKGISDTASFDITQYEYDGIIIRGTSIPGAVELNSRYITSDELIPLQAYDSPYNPYYTFARAILNGMRNVVNPKALQNPAQIPEPQDTYVIDPMRYFPNSYLYTVAAVTFQNEQWVDNWLLGVCTGRTNVEITLNGIPQIVPICQNFCAGGFESVILPRQNTSIVCNSEEWFANQIQTDKRAYPIVMPEVEKAIRDMVYRTEDEPVWLSAIYSVVPANRSPIESHNSGVDGVGNFISLVNGSYCFNPPLGDVGEGYIFDTYLGYLWELTWKAYPSSCDANYRPFYSENVWNPVQGGFANILTYPRSCENVDETLSQAYMRHLREIYGTNTPNSTFNRILRGEPINQLTNQQVRFGMSNRSVHMPVIGIKFYPESLESETPTPKIIQIVWYTYRFNIGEYTIIDGFPAHTTIPATDFEFVVYDANQNLITPLECP